MSNTIIELRHSYVTGNVPSSLANGEIAINTYDGKLFYRGGASNTIQTIERYEGPAGLDGEVQFNDSGVLGSSNKLTFNKTTGLLQTTNVTASNVTTQTFVQFGDGTKQYTANAGGGGGSTNSFGTVTANNGSIIADQANTEITFVGESGISVSSNVSAKKVIVSVPAGYTFTTADYGFVYDDTNVIYDYGTL
jgi:hypothetical protein